MVHEVLHRVDQHDLTPRRTATGPAVEVDRCGHVHERQRNELGEPTGLALQFRGAQQVPSPVLRLFHRAEHDRHVRTQADVVRRAYLLAGTILAAARGGAALLGSEPAWWKTNGALAIALAAGVALLVLYRSSQRAEPAV